ncbi:hypothetical protein CS542_03565 [Pedobacter sp. IW39]|nr:hypothetical protein CS542_03565 [Pedobacter sp. IW39]
MNAGVFTASGTQELAFRVLFNTLLKTGELNMNEVRQQSAKGCLFGLSAGSNGRFVSFGN